MDLVNDSPFPAERALYLDGDGRERLLVVLKATFRYDRGRVSEAERQEPIALADEHRGEPDASGLKRASDLAPVKPAAEVLVFGKARSSGRLRNSATVQLRFGPVQKQLIVHGDRRWGATGPTQAEPFEAIELCWERAFGGTEKKGSQLSRWDQNPVGVGFRPAGSTRSLLGTPLPNLEPPGTTWFSGGGDIPSVNLGPQPAAWPARARFAGTYDARWRRERAPLLPLDFDPRFHLCAPPDQLIPGQIQGGEPVRLTGLDELGPVEFTVPRLRPQVTLRVGEQEEVAVPRCDTALIDAERRLLSLVWRASFVVQGRVKRIRWIEIEPGASRGG